MVDWGCASFDPTPGLVGASGVLNVRIGVGYKWGGLLWGTYITIHVIFLHDSANQKVCFWQKHTN